MSASTSTPPSAAVIPGASPAPAALPFRDGTPEQYRALREYMRAVSYTYEEIYRRGRRRPDVGKGEGAADPERGAPEDAAELLILLYFDGLAVKWTAVRAGIDPHALALLEELGLLQSLATAPEFAVGTVLLYPIASVYVASDHPYLVAGTAGAMPDFVFAAMSWNTQEYMTLLPSAPCDAFAEMCGGTGVAALEAARTARRSCTLDITERATRFAEFNARFNGIENVTALQGDLYEPVRGMTFDRIAAHPPYVPAFHQELIFRDGGADGEQITRRIVEGLPEHLRPGGRLYCVCQATDRVDAPLERRLRTMLGAAESEFDVLVVELSKPTNPTEFYARQAWHRDGSGFAEVEARHKAFKAMGVTRLVYSLFVLQRREGPRPVFTVRREAGRTRSAQVEWILAWETLRASGLDGRDVLDRPLAVQPWVQMDVQLRPRDGQFHPVGTGVRSELPSRFDASCPPWMGAFLTKCNGRTTARELLASLREVRMVPPDASEEVFASLVADLVGAGVLAAEGLPTPPAYDAPLWARDDDATAGAGSEPGGA